MKSLLSILCFSLLFSLSADAQPKHPEGFKTLKIGDAAPDFSLPGIDGKTHTLGEYTGKKVLMVMFTCNHCPSAQALEPRFKDFVRTYEPKGVSIVVISPNSPKGIRPNELGYSLYGDGFEDMIKHAKDQGFNFPYLYDGETQSTAKAYGCLATPHVFLFDSENKLRYKGRFDDSRFLDPATIDTHDAIDATDALLAGKEIAVAETRPHGCTTKWAFKEDQVREHNDKIESTPCTIETIDDVGVAALLHNDTGRFRMINVWATWCVPCVREFPDLVAVSRKFGLRDFEFNSISMDKLSQKAKAEAFLSKQGAAPEAKLAKALKAEGKATPHFLYEGKTKDLAQALDPQWPGPLPYTILVDPKGEIVLRHSGMIDAEHLNKEIVEHIGKYYTPKPSKKK